MPVINSADEGRNQLHVGLPASNCLANRKQQRKVGVNAALLQLLSCLNAFPRCREFDQYTVNMNALGLVELDNSLATRKRRVGIKTQAGIYLG